MKLLFSVDICNDLELKYVKVIIPSNIQKILIITRYLLKKY